MTYKRIVHGGELYYGKHLMVEAKGCNDAILSIESLSLFLRDVVYRIDMVCFGEPVAFRFGEGDEVGISAIQLIETSNLAIHTNDGTREMYLDVFSCRDYETQIVIDALNEVFSPAQICQREIYRQ